jgi:hypothetical protein
MDGGPNSKNSDFVDIVSFSYRNELALLPIHFVIFRYAISPLLRFSLGMADSQKLKKAKQQSSNSIAQTARVTFFSRERHSASLSGAKKQTHPNALQAGNNPKKQS